MLFYEVLETYSCTPFIETSINAAFENNYFKLTNIWNFQWYDKFHSVNGSYKAQLPSDLLAFYEEYDIVPAIIQYTSHEKHWKNP